jgi:CubicO group peptidase (beta-lactamase class C family)
MALCVFQRGVLSDIEYVGTCCHKSPTVIDEATIWEAASLTKPLLARFVVYLAAAGQLDLDAPVQVDLETIRGAPDDRWGSLTARHILTHTSGLPNWRGPFEALRAGGWDGHGDDEPLTFERDPGQFSYSGEGFQVLLVALCRSQNLGPYDVLEPLLAELEMSSSSFVWQTSFEGRCAVPHSTQGECSPKMRPKTPRASGSLHTSLLDYSAFASTVLSEAGDDVFVPNVRLNETDGRSLGWATMVTDTGTVAWQHGDNLGFKHLVALRPEKGDGLVMFTNSDDGVHAYQRVCRKVLGVEVKYSP